MSGDIVRRAPGKLMLSGEYAVLGGAPAIVACVDRYVTARVRRAKTGAASAATLQGYDGAVRTFDVGADGVRWHGANAAPGLLDALLRRFPPGRDIEIEIDSSAFFDNGRKLGLGSSAAVAVAAGRALAAFAGDDAPMPGILAAHRDFQGGLGSGADIVAVDAGGLQSVRCPAGGEPVCDTLPWAAGLLIAPVMTGASASTVARVTRFERWRRGDGRAAEATLHGAARAVDTAWRSGDAGAILDTLSASLEILRDIDVKAGLDFFGGGHEAIGRLAAECGIFYKPCGAGGGDFGIALATDPEALTRFAASLAVTGHTMPPLSLLADCQQANSV